MQIQWLAGLWRVSLNPIEKSRAARQAARDDVTNKSLAFHDRDIRFARNGDEIIGRVAAQRTGGSKMKWNRNLMHRLAIQLHWPNAPAHQRTRLNGTAQSNHADVIAIVDF